MFIHSCGSNEIHKKTIIIDPPKSQGVYLFLLIKTTGRFFINGQIYYAKPNDIILYKKGTYQYYENVDEIYTDDFIFFECSNKEDEKFIDSLSLKYDQLLNLPNLLSLMNIAQTLVVEFQNHHSRRDESIDYLLKYFLIKLNEAMNSEIPDPILLERFNDLRTQFYTTPEKKWTITSMANYVNLSPSYMQTTYKKIFHTSCMADLIASRISYARELLTTTNLPINEIAAKCGYDSNAYFSKYFKRTCNMSPSEYRNQYHI